jgi:hypothetical protein
LRGFFVGEGVGKRLLASDHRADFADSRVCKPNGCQLLNPVNCEWQVPTKTDQLRPLQNTPQS